MTASSETRSGNTIGDFNSVVPPGTMQAVYVTTRTWAVRHPDVVASFRATLDEAVAFYRKPENQDAVLGSVAKWIKLPPKIVTATMLREKLQVKVEPEQLRFWVRLRQQGLIHEGIDPAKIIAP
jgi:ABC-type nitrate/sulfonate/bicarbonate transport system substrate-binding protein